MTSSRQPPPTRTSLLCPARKVRRRRVVAVRQQPRQHCRLAAALAPKAKLQASSRLLQQHLKRRLRIYATPQARQQRQVCALRATLSRRNNCCACSPLSPWRSALCGPRPWWLALGGFVELLASISRRLFHSLWSPQQLGKQNDRRSSFVRPLTEVLRHRWHHTWFFFPGLSSFLN